MSKKTSKATKAKNVPGPGPKSRAMKAVSRGVAAYTATSNPLFAIGSALIPEVDEFFHQREGSMKLKSTSVPAEVGLSVVGGVPPYVSLETKQRPGRSPMHRITQRMYAGYLYFGVTPTYYPYVYDSVGNSASVSIGQDLVFPIYATPPVNPASAQSNPWFLSPPNQFVSTIAKLHDHWKANRIRLVYVPGTSSSTAGNLSMAYTNLSYEQLYTGSSTNSRYTAATLNSYSTMAQFPLFTSGPVWQTQVLDITPKKFGVCEGPGDWLETFRTAASSSPYNPTVSNFKSTTPGSVIISVEGTGVNATVGHFFIEVDYVFAEPIPPWTSPANSYGSEVDDFHRLRVLFRNNPSLRQFLTGEGDIDLGKIDSKLLERFGLSARASLTGKSRQLLEFFDKNPSIGSDIPKRREDDEFTIVASPSKGAYK